MHILPVASIGLAVCAWAGEVIDMANISLSMISLFDPSEGEMLW
jgi:flagellar biosynthesis protein FliR